MSTHDFITITTPQDSTTFDPSLNARRLGMRQEDLNTYGERGYALMSTLTVPSPEGLVIVDTMGRSR